jgi:hypothetical protein
VKEKRKEYLNSCSHRDHRGRRDFLMPTKFCKEYSGGKRFSEIPSDPPLEKGGEGFQDHHNHEQDSSRMTTCFRLRPSLAVFSVTSVAKMFLVFVFALCSMLYALCSFPKRFRSLPSYAEVQGLRKV